MVVLSSLCHVFLTPPLCQQPEHRPYPTEKEHFSGRAAPSLTQTEVLRTGTSKVAGSVAHTTPSSGSTDTDTLKPM